jgi:hypothetical protein
MPAGNVSGLSEANHSDIIDVGWRRCGWRNEWCRPRVGVGVTAPGVNVWVGGRGYHHRRWYRHHWYRHHWHHHHWHHHH